MIGKWLGQGGKLGKLDGMGDSGAQKIKYQERIWRMGRNPVWFGYFVYFTFLHLVIIAFCGDTVISLNFGTQFEEIVAQKYSPFHYTCFSTVACFLWSDVLHTETSYVYHICYVHGDILEASDLAEGRGSSSWCLAQRVFLGPDVDWVWVICTEHFHGKNHIFSALETSDDTFSLGSMAWHSVFASNWGQESPERIWRGGMLRRCWD